MKYLKFITSLLAIGCFLHPAIFGQAKVGTTGAQFLDISPSVQAIGMGEAAAATTVHSAFYNNPASLGLIGIKRVAKLSFFPVKAKFPAGTGLQNYEFSAPVYSSSTGNILQSVSFGIYHTRLVSAEMIERDYDRLPTGRTYQYNSSVTNLSCSYAYLSTVQFSVGITMKSIDESANEYSSSGSAMDIGLLFRYPIFKNYTDIGSSYNLYMIPAIGFSLRNYGPDMEFNTNKYPLPKSRALGLAYEFGLRNFVDTRRELDAFRILLALEIDYQYGGSELHKIGTELSLYELFNIRLGQINFNENSNKQNTLGFSLSTDRIGKFLLLTNGGVTNSRFLEFITEKLSLEYNYAIKSNNYFDDITYHELVLSYHL